MNDVNKLIPPEIKQSIDASLVKYFRSFGLLGLVILVLIVCIARIWIETTMNRNIESYKNELERYSQKNLEIWKTQKDLTFEFIDFLEERWFNNPNLLDEKNDVLSILNQYYGKLYLVLDKPIIEKINKLIQGTTSETQRYYLYREIRIQLLKFLIDRAPDYGDCPYISRNIETAPIIKLEKRPENFNELKGVYPFIEEGDLPNTYKALPKFGEKESTKSETEPIK